MIKRYCLLILFLIPCAWASDYLPVWQAFQVHVESMNKTAIWVKFNIAPEYHIYQNKIHIQSQKDSSVQLGSPILPDPVMIKSDGLGEFLVYENNTAIQVPITDFGDGKLDVSIRYQGCKGLDLCFPEQEFDQKIDLVNPDSAIVLTSAMSSDEVSTDSWLNIFSNSNSSQISQFLSSSPIVIVFAFFILGLLIAFTPCVFPMLPILIGLISGKDIAVKRSFWLAFSYICGGAITYAIAGVVAASLGYSVSGLFQANWLNWVLVGLFVFFAISLFAGINLQLPLMLQNKLNNSMNRRNNGSLIGAFIVGGIANLVLSPCVTAPLAGALIYISTTGNQLLGGVALFALGLGSGIPLLIIAVFGKKLLPKTGNWMLNIKQILAMMMLLMALYMLSRVVFNSMVLLVLGALWLFALLWLIVDFFAIKKKYKLVVNTLIFLVIGSAVFLYITKLDTRGETNFYTITTIAELDQQLSSAKQHNQPVILDYYASWCVACKEMDIKTFSDPAISSKLNQFKLIRVDVSANDAQSQRLSQRYKVLAPPSLVFIDHQGKILTNYQVTGFISSSKLAVNLDDALVSSKDKFSCAENEHC